MPELVPPPLGVMLYWLWKEHYPDPLIQELRERHADVLAAVIRYRDAGLEPSCLWLMELGLDGSKGRDLGRLTR